MRHAFNLMCSCVLAVVALAGSARADIALPPRADDPPKHSAQTETRLIGSKTVWLEAIPEDRPLVLRLPRALLAELAPAQPGVAAPEARLDTRTLVAGVALSLAIGATGLMLVRRNKSTLAGVLVVGAVTMLGSVVWGNRPAPVHADNAIPRLPEKVELPSNAVELDVEIHVIDDTEPVSIGVTRATLEALLKKFDEAK